MAEKANAPYKTCFIAMPVTTPVSYADDLHDADHFSHVLKHLFTPALQRAGYRVIPPKMLGATLIHAEIIKHLEQADLVLADLSDHNPNVFFELGIRTALDRPVVLVKDGRTATIPFDLGTINVLTYDESLATWALDDEVKRLTEHVSNVPADKTSGNAMWRYFGLTKRGGPADAGSLDAKVDLLLAEVTKMRLAPEEPADDKVDRFTRTLEVLLEKNGSVAGLSIVRLSPTDLQIVIYSSNPVGPQMKEEIQRLGAAAGVTIANVVGLPPVPGSHARSW